MDIFEGHALDVLRDYDWLCWLREARAKWNLFAIQNSTYSQPPSAPWKLFLGALLLPLLSWGCGCCGTVKKYPAQLGLKAKWSREVGVRLEGDSSRPNRPGKFHLLLGTSTAEGNGDAGCVRGLRGWGSMVIIPGSLWTGSSPAAAHY